MVVARERMDRTVEGWNYRQAYEWGVARLQEAEVAEAELNARLLLEYICKTNRTTIFSLLPANLMIS